MGHEDARIVIHIALGAPQAATRQDLGKDTNAMRAIIDMGALIERPRAQGCVRGGAGRPRKTRLV